MDKKISSHKKLTHKGVVKSVDDKIIKVSITSLSACASCKASSVCGAGDQQEKIIEVKNIGKLYSIGENVEVALNQSLGFRALFLGYILPFIVLFISLIITVSLLNSQGLAGIISILVLVPYYIILYINREKIRNTFSFTIQKQYNFN